LNPRGAKRKDGWRRCRKSQPVRVDFVWTPQAREDLIEIYTYIALDNPSAAERVFDAVQNKAQLLANYPGWAFDGATSERQPEC